MSQLDFIGGILSGGALLLLPFFLPLFFVHTVRRRALYYVVGAVGCFLSYKVATLLWALLAVSLGSVIASLRHEDFSHTTDLTFRLVAPGLHEGHVFLALLPVLLLGTLLSVVILRILRRRFVAAGPVA